MSFPNNSNYQVGVWYYVTVISGLSQENVTVALWQERRVTGLYNQSHILDRMWNRNDFIRYYYI